MFLKKLADALVQRLVPRAEAGACCEEQGQCDIYPCPNGVGECLCCTKCNCGLQCVPYYGG